MLADKCILKDKSLVKKIMSQLILPKITKTGTDDHYECYRCCKGSDVAMSMTISKSKFVAGVQCLKRLYLQVHQPELAAQPDEVDEALMQKGAYGWRHA